MANYYGMGRSNYVRYDPKKLALLIELFDDLDISYGPDMVALLSPNSDDPCIFPETEEEHDLLKALGYEGEDEVNLSDVIHLILTDEPIVWFGIGHEKLRYLVGFAKATNPDGTTLNFLDLNEIYEGMEGTTRAEY